MYLGALSIGIEYKKNHHLDKELTYLFDKCIEKTGRVDNYIIEDAKNLVAVSTKLKGKIVLKSGSKFSVNAKSLLGVVLAKKLNWSDLTIVMDNDYYHEYEKFIID